MEYLFLYFISYYLFLVVNVYFIRKLACTITTGVFCNIQKIDFKIVYLKKRKSESLRFVSA